MRLSRNQTATKSADRPLRRPPPREVFVPVLRETSCHANAAALRALKGRRRRGKRCAVHGALRIYRRTDYIVCVLPREVAAEAQQMFSSRTNVRRVRRS